MFQGMNDNEKAMKVETSRPFEIALNDKGQQMVATRNVTLRGRSDHTFLSPDDPPFCFLNANCCASLRTAHCSLIPGSPATTRPTKMVLEPGIG